MNKNIKKNTFDVSTNEVYHDKTIQNISNFILMQYKEYRKQLASKLVYTRAFKGREDAKVLLKENQQTDEYIFARTVAHAVRKEVICRILSTEDKLEVIKQSLYNYLDMDLVNSLPQDKRELKRKLFKFVTNEENAFNKELIRKFLANIEFMNEVIRAGDKHFLSKVYGKYDAYDILRDNPSFVLNQMLHKPSFLASTVPKELLEDNGFMDIIAKDLKLPRQLCINIANKNNPEYEKSWEKIDDIYYNTLGLTEDDI